MPLPYSSVCKIARQTAIWRHNAAPVHSNHTFEDIL